MQYDVEGRFRKVERLILAAQSKDLDEEIASYYCKLGCIMTCGAVERSVAILILERVGQRSPPEVQSFLRTYFKRGVNYDCDEISSLLYRFKKEWGRRYEDYIAQNDPVKQGITSLYSVRNSVAHGGTNSTGPNNLKEYFYRAFDMIAELDSILHRLLGSIRLVR